MFIERRLNAHTDRVELWECEWEYPKGEPAKKTVIRLIGEEQPLKPEARDAHSTSTAICWSYGRTLGNIAVFSQAVLGSFTGNEGTDAKVACDFVNAAKFRNGAERWWCRTHQTHWGTKADLEAARLAGAMVCSNQSQLMSYVLNPQRLKVDEHAEVGIWCSLPAAISSHPIPKQAPKIHVHVRSQPGAPKIIDRDFNAISLHYNQSLGLFKNTEITSVNVTPPAALEFLRAMEEEREMDCVACSHCGFPHLDLGSFALIPHRKHFCGNCGRDSTWSKKPIVSTPLKPLHDQLTRSAKPIPVDRDLNMEKYDGLPFQMWASTPAIVWTAERPQEVGIHVHIRDGTTRVVDDTYREVIYRGKVLNRKDLLAQMIERTIV